jgi:O-antigen/teichoic acid export membrane protein
MLGLLTKQKRDILILTIGKILQIVIALVSIRVLTEVLSEQEIGNYYLLLTILAFFNFSFLNPLGQYYGRHLIQWRDNKNLSNATNMLLIVRLASIIFSVFISYGIYQVFEYDKYYTLSEFMLFIFISLVAGFHGVLLSAINVLGDRVKFITYTILTLFFALLLSLFIVYFINKSSIGWLYGVAISQLIFSIGLYKDIVKRNKFSIQKIKSILNKSYIRKISIFLLPIAITLFLQWGQNISYRFIVEVKYSLEVLAFIGVGLAVSGAIFSAVESLASQFYNPIYLRKITYADKVDRANAWNELADYMIPIYLLLTVFVIVLLPYLTNLLVAQKFYEAYIYATFGAVIEFFRVITNLVYMVSQSERKTKTTIFPYIIGFISTIVTLYFFDMSENFWMIPLLMAITNAVIFLLLFKNMKKLLNININMASIVKTFTLTIPLFCILFINNDNTISQTLLIISASGIYFIFLAYLVMQKRILVANK